MIWQRGFLRRGERTTTQRGGCHSAVAFEAQTPATERIGTRSPIWMSLLFLRLLPVEWFDETLP